MVESTNKYQQVPTSTNKYQQVPTSLSTKINMLIVVEKKNTVKQK